MFRADFRARQIEPREVLIVRSRLCSQPRRLCQRWCTEKGRSSHWKYLAVNLPLFCLLLTYLHLRAPQAPNNPAVARKSGDWLPLNPQPPAIPLACQPRVGGNPQSLFLVCRSWTVALHTPPLRLVASPSSSSRGPSIPASWRNSTS